MSALRGVAPHQSAAAFQRHSFQRPSNTPQGFSCQSKRPRTLGEGIDTREFSCRAESLGVSEVGPSLTSDTLTTVEDLEWVRVGIIGPPHGVKGQMKVRPTTDFPKERLGTPGDRWVQGPKGPLMKIKTKKTLMQLKRGFPAFYKGHHVWVISFEGITTRDQAETLRGFEILIPGDSRADLEHDDEFYVQDLMGLHVFKQGESEAMGTICDLYGGIGGCDLLKVRMTGEKNRTVLIPFSEQIVPVVDVKGGRVEIDPVEGLLSLPEETTKKASSERKRRPRSRNKHRVHDPKTETPQES